MARYTSNRFKDIVIGLPNYSQLKTVLQVVGRVGIGTNDAKTPLWIEGNTNIAGIITATTFKKEGGTNNQFLMADGSTNNLTYLTTETSTLDEILGRGNSTTKNLNVGIITATSIVGIASTAILATNAQGLTGTPSIVVDQITANNVSVAQTLTYEDVTSVDSVGMVTARMGIHVGPITAGVATVSTDGNANFTGIVTATSFVGDGSGLTGTGIGTNESVNTTGIITATSFVGNLTGNPTGSGANLTNLPAGQLTGVLPAISGANLTNLNIPVNSEWSFGSTGITTTKNLGINTSTVDNYETVGAANSFRGIYIGDGSLIFNARLDNINGYYIGTGRNALNAGPITLGSTMTLDGAWVIV